MDTIKAIEISTTKELVVQLEELLQSNKGYVFRGQPDNRYYLTPYAFRPDKTSELAANFPAPWQEWSQSDELREMVQPEMRFLIPSGSKLTAYILQYNYSLACYVEKHKQKFDIKTKEMYKLRPSGFWCEKKTFMDLTGRLLLSLTGIEDLQGRVLKYSTIYEELAGYDETLPQHYSVPTAALDWTRNPYNAVYFSLQNIPADAKHISLYAFREINRSERLPIVLMDACPGCQNERVKAQEGLFSYIRPGVVFLNYIVRHVTSGNGVWLTIEHLLSKNQDNFEVMKYDVPVSCYSELDALLKQKGINKKTLLLHDELK
jgi:hypothetical protein